jgi:hypothetical protein
MSSKGMPAETKPLNKTETTARKQARVRKGK